MSVELLDWSQMSREDRVASVRAIKGRLWGSPPKPINPADEILRLCGELAALRSENARLRSHVARLLRGAEEREERSDESNNRPSIELIMDVVMEQYTCTKGDICSHRRTRKHIEPRHAAMWLAKTLTLKSLPVIGRLMGGRDHTTVLNAVRRTESRMNSDNQFRAVMMMLKDRAISKNKLGEDSELLD